MASRESEIGVLPKLHKAVVAGNIKRVQNLLNNGVDVNDNDHGCIAGDTALGLAISRGNLQMVAILLEAGADPNKGNHYKTCLQLVEFALKVARGGPKPKDPTPFMEIKKLLIEHGAQTEASSSI